MQEIDIGIFGSILTAGLALLVSLYNYYLTKKGARLYIGEIIELGLMKTFSPSTKSSHLLCYFPLYFYNSGRGTAMITDIKIEIDNNGIITPFYLMKRIKGRKLEEIESQRPLLPIFVEESSGVLEYFEFMTKDVKIDRIDSVKITVFYNNKSSTSEFFLNLSYNDFKEFPQLNWINLFYKDEEYPKPIIFGKDM